MNMRLARPGVLVDINHIAGLEGICRNGRLTIGANTRPRASCAPPEVRGVRADRQRGLRHVGHVGIRTRGTFGGATAHADPASEIPAVLLALDARDDRARARRASARSRRTTFFVSTFTTELEDDEVAHRRQLPYPLDHAAWSFDEVSRRHGDFALVGVAAVAELDGAGDVPAGPASRISGVVGHARARHGRGGLARRRARWRTAPTTRAGCRAAARPAGRLPRLEHVSQRGHPRARSTRAIPDGDQGRSAMSTTEQTRRMRADRGAEHRHAINGVERRGSPSRACSSSTSCVTSST